MRTANDGAHKATTHLTNVLLAFQLLRRWDADSPREARVLEAGLASARALRRLFRGGDGARAGRRGPGPPEVAGREHRRGS